MGATAMLANADVALFPMVFTVGMQVLRPGCHELRLLVDGSEPAALRFPVNLAG